MGRCPALSSSPVQSDTGASRGWEVESPRGPNPFLEAGECHEWPDICVATDNYWLFHHLSGRQAQQSLTTRFWLPISAHKSLQHTVINQQGPGEQGLGGSSC